MPQKLIKKPYRERHIYVFPCKGCGRGRAQSFKRRKARELLCRSCRRGVNPDPNQQTMFPVVA